MYLPVMTHGAGNWTWANRIVSRNKVSMEC